MVKKWLSGLALTVLVAVAAVGGVSALSGGPARLPASDHAAQQGVDATNRAGPGDEAAQPAQQDGDDGGDQGQPAEGRGAERIAGVIADEFGVSAEDVMSLHEQGIGFGALFKLYTIARARGMSVNDLLASLPRGDDGHEFAFGKLMSELTGEQMAAVDAGPKNLGQLVSGSHAPEGAGHSAAAPGRGRSKNH